MKSSTVWHGHSTRPSLPVGTARKDSGHLSGQAPPSCCARPFGRLKAPPGLSLLRCAAQTRACLWQAEQAHHTTSKEKQSVPDGERPVVHIAIVCGLLKGASYSGARPVFFYASSFSARSIRYPTPTWVWIKCGASGHRSSFLRRDAI